MVRLIGILIGSALAVAFLLIAVGVPELAPQPEESLGGPSEPIAAEAAPTTSELVGGPSGPIAAEAAPTTPDLVGGPSGPIADEAEHDDETEALIDEIFAPEPEPISAAAAPTATDAIPAAIVEENWYAFWSPFRSEIAANGFIDKLQSTTGIDYRVVKVKTGVYEVAFAYVDDADIENKLARISDATGLDMTGS